MQRFNQTFSSPAVVRDSPGNLATKSPTVSPRRPEFANLLRGPSRPQPIKPSPRRSNFSSSRTSNEEDEDQQTKTSKDEDDQQMRRTFQIRAPLARLPILRVVPNHLTIGEERLGGLVSEFHEVYQPGSLEEQETGKWISVAERVPAKVLEDLVRSPGLPATAMQQMREIVQILQLQQKTGLRDGACLSRVAHQRIRKLEDSSGWRLHAKLAAISHAQTETPPLRQSCLDARYRLEMAQIQGVSWEELHQLCPNVLTAERRLQDLEMNENICLLDFEIEFGRRWAGECIAFLERKAPPLGLAKDAVALAIKAFAHIPNATQHFSLPRVTLTSGDPCTKEETWPTTGEMGDSQLRAISAGLIRRLDMNKDHYPADFARFFFITSFARRKMCDLLQAALESKARYVIPETGEEWGTSTLQVIYEKLAKIEEGYCGFLAGCSFRRLFVPGIAIKMKKIQKKRMLRRHSALENLRDKILCLGTSTNGEVPDKDTVSEQLKEALRQALTTWVPIGKSRPLAMKVNDMPLQAPGGRRQSYLALDADQSPVASLDVAESLAKSVNDLPTLLKPLSMPRSYLQAVKAEQDRFVVDDSHPEAFGTHGFVARNCLLFGSMQDKSPGVEIELFTVSQKEKIEDEELTFIPEEIVGEQAAPLVSTTTETALVTVSLWEWSTAEVQFFFRTLGYAAQVQDAINLVPEFLGLLTEQRLMNVQRLAVVGLESLAALEEDLFLSCPQLKDLDLRDCEKLQSITGLESAVSLESMKLANCKALECFNTPTSRQTAFTFGGAGVNTVPAPSLKFVDLHGCLSLSVEQILQLLDRPSETSETLDRLQLLDPANSETLAPVEPVVQVLTEIGALRKGDHAAIKAFFVDDGGDAVYELVGPLVECSEDELPPKVVTQIVPMKQEDVSFSRVLVEESLRYLGRDRCGGLISCVWPTPDLGELNSSLSTEMRFSACQGVRAKLVRAIEAAKKASSAEQAACGQELLTSLKRLDVLPGAPDRKSKAAPDRKSKATTNVAPGDKDVDDLLGFPKEPAIDYPTVRSVICSPCQPICKAVKLKHLSCLLCGKVVDITRWEVHETQECSGRKCLCSCLGARGLKVPTIGGSDNWVPCGMPVKVADMAHHQKVEQALQKALVTWSVELMQQAIRDAKKKLGDSPTTLCKPQIIEAQARLKRITEKVQLVKPIVKKGNIDIDFERCTLTINKTIQFAPRAAPDTSAEIDPKHATEADDIISDLAVVLSAFQARMIVEGHTGSTNPPEYWQALADNRAKLLVSILASKGVPDGVAIPRGEPGGGAKVLVYTAEEEEEEEEVED